LYAYYNLPEVSDQRENVRGHCPRRKILWIVGEGGMARELTVLGKFLDPSRQIGRLQCWSMVMLSLKWKETE